MDKMGPGGPRSRRLPVWALAALKQKAEAAPLSQLFSAGAIARHLEEAYAIAVARARRNEPAQDIVVRA